MESLTLDTTDAARKLAADRGILQFITTAGERLMLSVVDNHRNQTPLSVLFPVASKTSRQPKSIVSPVDAKPIPVSVGVDEMPDPGNPIVEKWNLGIERRMEKGMTRA